MLHPNVKMLIYRINLKMKAVAKELMFSLNKVRYDLNSEGCACG